METEHLCILFILIIFCFSSISFGQSQKKIVIASTTSTYDSGLLNELKPEVGILIVAPEREISTIYKPYTK